ncbi:PKD domain-containing protein [Janthinobacterium fluminis]|uniref:PKD domain-containing protein n=1 Tax=Janthinobacterium fluminis TaxID=2987524 RepID=A0ABT5K4H7_9BURK|nr:PKD domain-containing protein [Janthinobacterium fluminis]MDC8759890.1 PKD domain-containing protein [Janthinobacterium fluminis]
MNKHHPHQPSNDKRGGRAGVYVLAGAVAVLAGAGVLALAGPAEPAGAAAPLAAAPTAPAAAPPRAGLAATQALSPFAAPDAAAPARQEAQAGVESAQALALRKATLAVYEKMEMPADFVPVSAAGSTDNAPFARIQLAEFSSGQRAIDLLGADLAPVASWYGMTTQALSQLLLTDPSVHLDRKGRIVHIDEGSGATAAGAIAGATATGTTTATPFPLDQTFKLHTRPDSTRVLFLDFNGQGNYPAFSLDGVPATFSDAERLLIQKVWQRVAEDYAAFDVDVTTEAPAVTLGKIGATVLITPQSSGAGGYAYLNSFAKFAANAAPAFCFPNNLANSEKPIGECVAHEAGHTLGLQHQGSAAGAYYGGQGDGVTGWAPIMGVSYYKNLTQWSKGEYSGANNKEDAYAVMARQGLKPRADDHGNTLATATALLGKSANGLSNLSAAGVIEAPGDTDMFSFVAGAGALNLKATAAALGANVDIALQLFDASGKLLASANPTAELNASLSVNLAQAGTYYLSVKGAGYGEPLKTGYSNYGSIGQYSIAGTAALVVFAPPVAAPKASVSAGKAALAVSFSGAASTASGAQIASYQWSFGDGTAGASGVNASHSYTKVGTFEAVLKVTDSRGQSASKGMNIVVTAK